MKKSIDKIFDEAKAGELDALISKNPPPQPSADTLSAVKSKVYAATGLSAPKKKQTILFRWQTYAVAACLMLLIGLGMGTLLRNPVSATFTVDVNPSIEISLNKNEEIVAAKPLNSDAEAVLQGLKLKNRELEDGLEDIVRSLVSKGFISEASNSVLVSIPGDDDESVLLRDRLSLMIKQLLDDDGLEGAVLSHTYSSDSSVGALAEQFGISVGKAAIIERITELNGKYVFEELVDIPINELNLILEKCADSDISASRQGKASRTTYISPDEALNAALRDLGITKNDISDIEVELEYFHGLLVYEVEFNYGRNEFEYAVNATDGSVLKAEIETDDDDDDGDDDDYVAPPSNIISHTAALDAALADAKVSRGEIFDVSVELDEDDGRLSYEVKFETASAEYEYDISAVDGSVIGKEIDREDD